MTRNEVISTYLGLLDDRAKTCNQRLTRQSYLFVVVVLFVYLAQSSSLTELQFLGAKLSIPLSTIVTFAPVILTLLYYSVSCYARLEDECYNQIRRYLPALAKDVGFDLPDWQLKLIESPSYYTISEIRDMTETSNRFLRIMQIPMNMALSLGYLLVMPGVVCYIMYLSCRNSFSVGVAVMYAVCVLILLFSIVQHVENFRFPQATTNEEPHSVAEAAETQQPPERDK